MKTHDLKILPKYFKEVWYGRKTFEIRKNDRNYEVGDKIILHEWDGAYLGGEIEGFITHITSFAQAEDYVVFGFEIESMK